MGFKLSRLAQAIMAVAFCSTASLAAEKADDFYIEIKGPESSVQQSPQPVQPTAPSTIKNQVELSDSSALHSGKAKINRFFLPKSSVLWASEKD